MNSLEFKVDDKTIIVKKPSITDEMNAKFIANEAFQEALKSKALFKEELDKALRERGLWDDSKKQALEEAQELIKNNLLVLKKGGIKKSEAKKLAIEVRFARAKILVLLTTYNKFDDFTVESQVQNKKFNFLVSACSYYEDGTKVFSNLNDYLNRSEEKIAIECATKFAELYNGYDPDWQKKLPENEFLITHKLCNENLELVDKDGHLIDLDGNTIDSNNNLVKNIDGVECIVDENGNILDKDGLPKVEQQPFLDD